VNTVRVIQKTTLEISKSPKVKVVCGERADRILRFYNYDTGI